MEIHTMPGHLIRRLNQISVACFMERMNRAGLNLTPVQYAALCAIRDFPGIDQATVAGLVAYDRATLGRVIDRLEERGLIRRNVSPNDRRARVLHLSADGADLLREACPHVKDVQPEILAGLSEGEATTFLELLQKATRAGNDMSRAPLRTPAQGHNNEG